MRAMIHPTWRRLSPFFVLVFVLFVHCEGRTPPEDNSAVLDLTQADDVMGQPGFFRVARVDGVWWFIDPEDRLFFSRAVNHIEPHFVLAEPWRERALDRWGSDLENADGTPNSEGVAAQKFMDEHLDLVQGWGFNSLGHQNSIPQSRLPWVASFRPADLEGWPGVKKEYHDPFSRRTAALIGTKARNWAEDKRDNPLIMGVDQRIFLPQIAEAWYSMLRRILRRTMPNHLIFGDKLVPFKSVPDWMPPILRDNVDVLFLMWFEETEAQLSRLRELHLETGKPIVMGDTSYAHPNAAVPEPKGVHRDSQDAVGRAYAEYLSTMAGEPYFVGWHHCGVIEATPDLEDIHVLISRQNGLMHGDGEVYQDAVRHIEKANRAAHALHEQVVVAPPPSCNTSEERGYKLTQVGDRVWELRPRQTSGFPSKPISWIIGDDAVAVYDTGTPEAATLAVSLIRSQTDLPIAHIIYSHHHGTQLMGAEVLKKADDGEIIAYQGLVQELDLVHGLDRYHARLASIQFDEPEGPPPRYLYPDRTYDRPMTLDLGGVSLTLLHLDGEAADYTVMWWPEGRIAWVADLLPGGMPMVASPMKRVRDEVRWRASLQSIKDLAPLAVLRTASIPSCDPALTNLQINTQMQLLDVLHLAVIRELNVGSSVEEAVAAIELPPYLRDSPFLVERYGTLEFAVRGMYHRYSGWFDQDGSNAKLTDPRARAAAFIQRMGGPSRVSRHAAQALEAGDPSTALWYLDLLLAVDDRDPEAHRQKAQALRAMAEDPTTDTKILKNLFRGTATRHETAARTAPP